MKYKEIPYSEIKSNIYDRFIDMLVKNTSFSDVYESDMDYNANIIYDYVTYVKYPFFDDEVELKFDNSESWTMNVPARYHLYQMLQVVGVDSETDPNIAEAIWIEYINRFEIKIKDFIKQFMDYEG